MWSELVRVWSAQRFVGEGCGLHRGLLVRVWSAQRFVGEGVVCAEVSW